MYWHYIGWCIRKCRCVLFIQSVLIAAEMLVVIMLERTSSMGCVGRIERVEGQCSSLP